MIIDILFRTTERNQLPHTMIFDNSPSKAINPVQVSDDFDITNDYIMRQLRENHREDYCRHPADR